MRRHSKLVIKGKVHYNRTYLKNGHPFMAFSSRVFGHNSANSFAKLTGTVPIGPSIPEEFEKNIRRGIMSLLRKVELDKYFIDVSFNPYGRSSVAIKCYTKELSKENILQEAEKYSSNNTKINEIKEKIVYLIDQNVNEEEWQIGVTKLVNEILENGKEEIQEILEDNGLSMEIYSAKLYI